MAFFKLNENSLFAILLRAGWWVSLAVGLGVFAVVRLFLDAGFAFFAALPFFVIAAVVAWKRLRTPGGARLERAMDRLRALGWEEFAGALEAGYRREGYAVTRTQGAADLELEKNGQRSLVAAKRWKATRTGIEPLKDLAAAAEAKGAAECIYVLSGDLSDNARKFAEISKIKLLRGADIVQLARE